MAYIDMSNDNIHLFNFSNYVRPKLVVNKQNDWVLNGRKNEFYQYIIDRNNGSSTLSSLNNSFTDLIYGQGLYAKNAKSNINDWTKLKTVLNDKDLRKIIADFQVFGEASMQIIKEKGGGLSSISHLPKQMVVPSIENDDFEIESYWFCRDWSNTFKNVPESFPAYGSGANDEIYVIRPYVVGGQYFGQPDGLSALTFAEIEEEIANLYITSVKSGLSAGYIINVPESQGWSDEVKQRFQDQVKAKLTGSNNASTFIVSFNGTDISVTVEPFPVNEQIHKQWESLNEICIQKILTSNRATSPSLIGIVSSSGFSNTADEMAKAEEELYRRVIQPKQKEIIDALEEILNDNGINLDLYFKPLTTPAETNVAMSSDDVYDIELGSILDRYAEDAPEGYDLHSSELVSLSAIQKSEQDTDIWKIRYAYVEGTNKIPKGSSRFFCTKMRALEMAGKVFRKEDIIQMGDDGVNGQFAHSGGKYSIWLFGGGVNCYHRWERRIFKKRLQEDGKPYIGNALQNTDYVNVNEARKQGAPIPQNEPDVAIAEIDKPNRGSLK
jgi:hypothetical protein